jgi:predicted NBD/HSP70 family sugar kinase
VRNDRGAAAADTPLNLREVGRLRVLEALHTNARTSRPELVRATGLSRATVSSLISDLISNGLVADDAGAAEVDERRFGRPAQFLSLVPSAAHAIGVDIGHQHVRVMLCDLFGAPLWVGVADQDVDRAPQETLDLAAELVQQALGEGGVPRDKVLGIGADIASPVDKTTGALGCEGIMSGWTGVRPARELERRTGLKVQITNDANAGALAEYRYGAARNTKDMVYIRLSAGIGAGVMSDGRLLLGAKGLTGEIGHLLISPEGRICRCGNRGCLETVASPVAISRLLADSWGEPVSPRDLPGLFADGNKAALRALEDAGEAVGRALASLVTLVNPELIVVGGDLATAGDALLDPIRRGIRRYALPSAAENLAIVAGQLGDNAEVRGAASIVLSQAPRTLASLV